MSTRPIKISEETYQTLKMMKQNLFPFPVSFSKVVGYATDKLNEELLYAKKKPKKRKQNKKDPRDELPLRRTISLYKYDKLLKAIFDRIKADDRYTARLVKSYESLSKNFDDQTKWQDALVNDIILKHKRIKTQDKVQKATIKEVAKRFEEYETANKELKEQNEYMKRKLYGKFTYDIKQFVKKHKNKKDLN